MPLQALEVPGCVQFQKSALLILIPSRSDMPTPNDNPREVDSLVSAAEAAVRAANGDAPTAQSAVTRASLLAPVLAIGTLAGVLYVEWPALSGAHDRERMTEAAVAGLSVAGHLVEDYAGASGRLPESLDSLGLVGSGLLYTHADSSYSIALITSDGDTVTHRGIVHLRSGGRP